MALNNVKELTVPVNGTNKAVKKIEDSNGNIIWGSESAFPYRRLQYLVFSGTEYILTNDKPTNDRHYILDFDLSAWSNDKFIFASGGDVTADGSQRVTVRTSNTNIQSRYGRNSSGNSSITAVTANTYYELRVRIYSDFTARFAVLNAQGQVINYKAYNTALTFTPDNMTTFGIMCYNLGSSVVSYSKGKVYRYYHTNYSTGQILGNCYPCQRKSDGVCGLYDVVNHEFLPMQGTNITSSAAGPLVDEYWDLTA